MASFSWKTVKFLQTVDKLNDTLSFEDGMKCRECRPIKEHEDYTDRAFEELCGSESGTRCLKVVEEKGAFHLQLSPTLSIVHILHPAFPPAPHTLHLLLFPDTHTHVHVHAHTHKQNIYTHTKIKVVTFSKRTTNTEKKTSVFLVNQ